MSTNVGINLIILLSNIIDFVSSVDFMAFVSTYLSPTDCIAVVNSILCPMLVYRLANAKRSLDNLRHNFVFLEGIEYRSEY